MRVVVFCLLCSACATLTGADTGSGPGTGLDATGSYFGTCTGDLLAQALAISATLDLTEDAGALTGQLDVSAALGTESSGAFVAQVTGSRTGNLVSLDATNQTPTGGVLGDFSMELLLAGDQLSGDLIVPTPGDATHVPCILSR